MKIAFLIATVHDVGGTAGAVVTQANALAARHDVRIVSVYQKQETHFAIDARVRVDTLVDLRREQPVLEGVDPETAAAVRGRPTVLVPRGTDPTLDGLADIALENHLPTLDADVLVTVTPALMSYAVQLAPRTVAVVHQEHRSTSQRESGLTEVLHSARRVDVLAMLTEPMSAWLRTTLGAEAPEVVTVPNALAPGYRPRSRRDQPVILAAGRFAGEKQWPLLISAFGSIADRIPDWRLRILGQGDTMFRSKATVRKLGLWDRVELPGPSQDMVSEWARASIMALVSRPGEGFPLVIQEAMAAALPVVAFDMPSGPRDQIEHGVDGLLVAQGSQQGLARSLLELASSQNLRDRIGEAAAVKARSWDSGTITARWEEIYQRAVAGHASRLGRAGQAHLRTLQRDGAVTPPADLAPAGCEVPELTPDEAQRRVFAVAVDAARRTMAESCDLWFARPPRPGRHPDLVLPMTHRNRFLEVLQRLEVPAWISLHDPEHRGWPSRRGRVADMARHLTQGRTARLELGPWPLATTSLGAHAALTAQAATVSVSFWEADPDGRLHSPDFPSAYTHSMPSDAELVEAPVLGTTVTTHSLMVEPVVGQVDLDVDVVLTWVDGADPDWQSRRLARQQHPSSEPLVEHETAASGPSRFLDRGELRYAMRSVHLFAPWVRRIFLVTDRQVPAWLDTSHPSVEVVDHREILPASALPTFNSHAIEAAIHRIQGLSEHFLYLNDDMILGGPTWREDFFDAGGRAAVFVSPLTFGLDERGALPWQRAAMNNRRLLHEAFGRVFFQTVAHGPYPHRVSVLKEIAERFPDAIEATWHSPFRSDGDVSMLSSLAQHYGLATGRAYLVPHEGAYLSLTDATLRRRLMQLMDRAQSFICLNDGLSHSRRPDAVVEAVAEFLTAYTPIAAPWERS